MKVTRAIRMEFEPKDKPFDAYEAAMEAGSPSLAHVAMKACEAARETGLRKGFVEVPEKDGRTCPPLPLDKGLEERWRPGCYAEIGGADD